jgi:hypothetical protein
MKKTVNMRMGRTTISETDPAAVYEVAVLCWTCIAELLIINACMWYAYLT